MTLIKREDAIDAICKEWCYVTYGNCPHVDDGFVCDGCDDVKALNALPSADAVSREEYEDIIKDYRKQYENMNNEIADLEAKLSADAEWIPCNEKLPDNKTYVLTTIQAIDAVEVVRCKDCRHRDLFSCPLTDNDFQKDDDFCSWGERKGGDDE